MILTLSLIWLIFLGLCIGSFLNVVIARLPHGESIVTPRSKCPHCGHAIAWYENIPVLSYLLLRGRCSSCHARISSRYVWVELLTALLFYACLRRFDWAYPLAPALMMVTLLIPLIFIDAEHWILPFELTLPGIAAGILMQIPLGKDALLNAVIGAVVGFLVFRAIEFFGWLAFRKEAMGAGDKFLFALVCAFLSWRPVLGLILLANFQGAIFGLVRWALTGRAGPPPETPGTPEPAPPVMSWAFLAPGLSLARRLWLLPYSIFLQPIPDDPVDVAGEEVEWVPGATNMPFGPWIAIAGLEIMLLGPQIARIPNEVIKSMVGG